MYCRLDSEAETPPGTQWPARLADVTYSTRGLLRLRPGHLAATTPTRAATVPPRPGQVPDKALIVADGRRRGAAAERIHHGDAAEVALISAASTRRTRSRA